MSSALFTDWLAQARRAIEDLPEWAKYTLGAAVAVPTLFTLYKKYKGRKSPLKENWKKGARFIQS